MKIHIGTENINSCHDFAIFMADQWRNYRPRSPCNAGGPDEMGGPKFQN